MQTNVRHLSLGSLDCRLIAASTRRIVYLLLPAAVPDEWLEEASRRGGGVSVAAITGMDWSSTMTPWVARGVPDRSREFAGEATAFAGGLSRAVIPKIESELRLDNPERTLLGVSLSGLFAVWEWTVGRMFTNIISISGSMWYAGFTSWFGRHFNRRKGGAALFMLGRGESRSSVPEFRHVDTDTEAVVRHIEETGTDVTFEHVEGSHTRDMRGRIAKAMDWLARRRQPGSTS